MAGHSEENVTFQMGSKFNKLFTMIRAQTLEKEMATRSSVLAGRIPGTGEPGGLLSICEVAQSRT